MSAMAAMRGHIVGLWGSLRDGEVFKSLLGWVMAGHRGNRAKLLSHKLYFTGLSTPIDALPQACLLPAS